METQQLNFCPTLQVLDMSTLGDASPRVDILSTCKVGQKIRVSLPLLTCSPSTWSRLLYRGGRKSRRDLRITLYLLLFHGKYCYANELQCVVCTYMACLVLETAYRECCVWEDYRKIDVMWWSSLDIRLKGRRNSHVSFEQIMVAELPFVNSLVKHDI